jgi:hypothetical protein
VSEDIAMPLLDHFHAPLWPSRGWHSFHNAWATFIAADINKHLPEGYFAEGNVQFNIEIDVATLRRDGTAPPLDSGWEAPAPVLTVPFGAATDIIEILISESSAGTNLVGAVELVSPANKDRPETRTAFATKCASYVQQGIGLAIVDVVTTRKANLHNQLMQLISAGWMDCEMDLYAVAYHPVQEKPQPPLGPRNGEIKKNLEIWPYEMKLGAPLPTLPLCLKGGLTLRLDLEETYMRTCSEYRISLNGK